jgi:glycosyltransferase involved in cell wall biosynthesis
MAAAMDALADLLETRGPVVRIRTVPKDRPIGYLYHLKRAYLVALAALRLVPLRANCDAVLLSVDAGKGMVYVVVLTWVARRLRYRVSLQHHSYAYISRRSTLAGVLVDVGGPRAEHLHSCQIACDDFRRVYPRALTTRAVSVAYALQSPTAYRRTQSSTAARTLRVGHLSNLTVEKGLERVIRLGQAAIHQGVVEKVILAGPIMGSAERALIRTALSERGFEYRGPVTGQSKEDFFHDIDVFLFPTRYRNESYGLVVWEAMLRGVPVIAYRAGCLTQTLVGLDSLVLEPGDDFTKKAMRQIERWYQHPDEFSKAGAAAVTYARDEREKAISDALVLGGELFASRVHSP